MSEGDHLRKMAAYRAGALTGDFFDSDAEAARLRLDMLTPEDLLRVERIIREKLATESGNPNVDADVQAHDRAAVLVLAERLANEMRSSNNMIHD